MVDIKKKMRTKRRSFTIPIILLCLVVLFAAATLVELPRNVTHALSGGENTRVVALTFDDGPHEQYTPLVLDALAASNARATFFVSGWRLRDAENVEILQRTAQEGHQLANHRYTHAEPSPTLTAEEFEEELMLTNTLIERYTGQKPTAFRHPWGTGSDELDAIAEGLGFTVYDWDSSVKDGRDFSELDQQRVDMYASRIVEAIGDGHIVLLHDARGNINSATALGVALPYFPPERYQFVTLDEFEYLRPRLTFAQIVRNRLL
jgi:peptidoglycan/xylan/chitin deacetylase (PgdA/CDA1 family)